MEQNLLAEYSKELDMSHTMSIQSLIDSHRHLRNLNKATSNERLKELQKARDAGNKQGMEMVTHGQYIAVEKLKKMTFAEVVEFIGVDERY